VPAQAAPPIYLDYNASAPLAPEARQAMLRCFDPAYGNPSSLHRAGQAARVAVEEARDEIAAFAGAPAESVVFVSGGTEADNLALRGIMEASRSRGAGTHLLVSAVEHPAVLLTAQALSEGGFQVGVIPVDAQGRVDPRDVEKRLRPDTALVSVMLANHEVGTVQPARAIADLLKPRRIALHVDAVQAAAHLPVTLELLGADLLSLSAHKMGGPKGIGALVVRPGAELRPQITGGMQQARRRGGTESPALCAGFGAAVRRLRAGAPHDRIRALRDRLEERILQTVPGSRALATGVERLAGTSCIVFDGVRGDALVVALDLEGVQASFGAACASGMARPSHVLAAMGVPAAVALGAVRFSLGVETTAEEIERSAETVCRVVSRVRSRGVAA
jgi:cysteine desulfurase